MPRRHDDDELDGLDGEGQLSGQPVESRGRPGEEPDREGSDVVGRPPVVLDRVDRRVLELLRDDGRLAVAALAERAGVSRANAYTRLERLRSEGVIRGFSASVDSRRLGLGIAALVLIAGRQPAWRSLREELLRMPEIEFCVFTTGEYDALILVRVPDVETLRDVILERLQSMPTVRATQTIFVLDEVVRRPFVLPS
jgi:Lrp/AsnC family transcriptional regulator, leucine-responsive regulatory protein